MTCEWMWMAAGLTVIAAAAAVVASRRITATHVRRALQAERARITRELHDSIAQGMTGIGLHLETAVVTLADPAQATEHINAAKALVRTTLLDVKHILLDLPPAALEGRELVEALQEMLRNLTAGLPVATCFRVEGVSRNLDSAANANVFRIAQEAVTNALRHSRAKRIEMVLHFSASSMRLCVRDDGGGSGAFRRDDVAAAGKHGIAGMYERAQKLNAVLHARPNGRGIEVVLEVPL